MKIWTFKSFTFLNIRHQVKYWQTYFVVVLFLKKIVFAKFVFHNVTLKCGKVYCTIYVSFSPKYDIHNTYTNVTSFCNKTILQYDVTFSNVTT